MEPSGCCLSRQTWAVLSMHNSRPGWGGALCFLSRLLRTTSADGARGVPGLPHQHMGYICAKTHNWHTATWTIDIIIIWLTVHIEILKHGFKYGHLKHWKRTCNLWPKISNKFLSVLKIFGHGYCFDTIVFPFRNSVLGVCHSNFCIATCHISYMDTGKGHWTNESSSSFSCTNWRTGLSHYNNLEAYHNQTMP